MDRFFEVLNMPLAYHLVSGAFLRMSLIVYGNYHDKNYELPYTDIDYRVFTDAARHVLNGDSPYKRHTYRYSPIIAFLMIPNVIIGKEFGKVLFSLFDLLITLAVKLLVEKQLKKAKNAWKIANYCSFFWLYNPLSIGISTRGNADSLPCFLIIISLVFLQTDLVKGLFKYILSGVLLGFSIHLRLYPLVFSFPMYLSLGEYKIKRNTGLKEGIISLIPNIKQITLALSCIITLVLLTCGIYSLYGYEFLFETYIYHLFRKDTRHNFSVLFYYSYLTMDQLVFDVVKALSQIFEGVILFVFSLTFGCDPKTLPFALFCQTIVLVAYNSVITSQYFVWFLSLMPLIAHEFKIPLYRASVLAIIWISAQSAWLSSAYLLELRGREVFLLLWFGSIMFFCSNIYILYRLVKCYSPGYGFGLVNISEDFKSK